MRILPPSVPDAFSFIGYLSYLNLLYNLQKRLDIMFNEMENAGLPAPEYSDNAFMLNATIRNSKNDSVNGENDSVNDSVNSKSISKTEKLVYEAIILNPSITREELMEALRKSISTVDRALKGLKEKGFIEHGGSDKTGHWIIK